MRLGVSYHGSRRLDHVERDLDAIATAGASLVVHCVPEDDVAFRPDRIGELVRATRSRGLEALLDPWAVLGLFGGEALSFAIARDPGIRQRLSDGRDVPAACPNHERTAAWLARWVEAAIRSGADGILWDEPHLWLPSWDDWNDGPLDAWSCACDACREAWAAGRHGAPGGPFPAGLTPELRAFRVRSLLALLEGGLATARAAGLRNVLTLLPVGEEAPESIPWEGAAALPGLDGIGTDPYWFLHGEPVLPYVADHAARTVAVARAHRLRSHCWVALFGVDPARAGELATAVEAAAAAGIEEVLAWSYPGGAVERPGTLPEAEAWAMVAAAARSADTTAAAVAGRG
ncbi:MAG: hypothetical protein RL338_1741 [Chloroflexota bacterium]